MRKFLAIFLTVAMLASFAVVPALAATTYEVYDKPGNYVAASKYTNKVAEITSAAGKTFELRKVEDGKAPVVLELKNPETTSGDFTITHVKDAAGKVVAITVKVKDAKPGTVAPIELTDGTNKATVYVQAGKTTDATLDSLKIKTPDSTLLVADSIITLKLDKTPATSNEPVYWFSSNPSVLDFPTDADTDSDNEKATFKADADVDTTTPVVVRAISQSGKQDEITLYVIKGVVATGISFNKGIFEVAANEDNTVDLETTVSPANGKATGLTYSAITASPVESSTGNGVDFTVDPKTGEFKIDAITGNPVYPLFVTVQAQVTGKNGVPLRANAIVKIGEPSATNRVIVMANEPTSGKLGVGQTYQYTATVYKTNADPRKNEVVKDAKIEWYSSKPSVATVDKKTGLVTAVAKGSANIIAVSAGAKNVDGLPQVETSLTVVGKDEIAAGTVKYVKPGKLAVRALPDYKSTKIGELTQGALVDVLDTVGIYAKIAFDSSYAYVAAEYLGDPVNFSVTSSKLAVRSFPGATAALKTLVYGDTVKVIGKYASNPAWTAILLDDTTIAYVASANIAEGTQVGIVTSGTLTMRVGASTTSAAFANKLVKGQTVEIIGKEGSFLKVKTAEGFVGYAAASYITIL